MRKPCPVWELALAAVRSCGVLGKAAPGLVGTGACSAARWPIASSARIERVANTKSFRAAGECSGRFDVQDAMPDVDPAAIESLLQEAALRRGVTVDTYRGLIQAITDRAGAPFATRFQVIAVFEKLPPGERNTLFEQLPIIEQQAARFGVSVGRFVAIMLDEDDGASPAQHTDPPAAPRVSEPMPDFRARAGRVRYAPYCAVEACRNLSA